MLCSRNALDCIIHEDGDGRRRLTHKRQIVTLEQDRALLILLVKTLRDSDETEVSNLVKAIRSGASLAEINAFLTESPGLSEPYQAAETRNNGNSDRRKSDTRQNYLNFNQLLA
jgi:hypothetical protein